MKKTTYLYFLAVSILAICVPFLVSAQLVYYSSSTTIQDIMNNTTILTGLIFGTVAVVCFVLAGILFLTAQGDMEKVKTAKHATIWGVVGVGVGLIAFGIIRLVANFYNM